MIIAVPLARAMQMTVYDVVDMIAMRNDFMPAGSAMHMPSFVAVAGVLGSTLALVTRVNRKRTLVSMAFVHVMQVAIMNVINVFTVFDGCMPAALTMSMLMIIMCFAAHQSLLVPSARVMLSELNLESDFHFQNCLWRRLPSHIPAMNTIKTSNAFFVNTNYADNRNDQRHKASKNC